MQVQYNRSLLPALLAVLSLVPNPSLSDSGPFGLPSLCGFRWATGLPCPVCGMTRSLICAAHGAFSLAFAFHPLGSLLWTGLIGLALWPLLRRVPILRRVAESEAVRTWVVGIGTSLLLLVWALRLLHILPTPP